MNRGEPDYPDQFESLTGFSPLRWQSRLFNKFVFGDLPETCDIPTGLGKTSVLVVWLLALIRQAKQGSVNLPRRLIYIVNRRTVVDQATEIVEAMRDRLADPRDHQWQEHASTLEALATVLHELCASEGPPLAVSTLRGELADNQEWKADPARPAIVVGTIDMIGSKILFSGYGDGRYLRTHHAGLIGQDALIVHDEAHLTPAFSDLLRSITAEQHRELGALEHQDPITRPVRVIELSATSRTATDHPFTLEPEAADKDDELVQQRLAARKILFLHPVEEEDVLSRVVEMGEGYDGQPVRVLIYVRSPETALKVSSALAKSLGGDRVALLTGTIRGHERDLLVEANPVYRSFLNPGPSIEETLYLVSTAAGEVGVDLDADHLVCDLTTLDALIQRLGRVNRRGEGGREARVDVVGQPPAKAKPSPFNSSLSATFELLRSWTESSPDGLEVGPAALRKLVATTDNDRIASAYSPTPPSPSLTDVLLDSWSLTSIQDLPGRMDIAPFLHGLTVDPPESYVAWRHEVRLLADGEIDPAALRQWFRACPIESRERLRDRTDRVKDTLKRMLRSHQKQQKGIDFDVVILGERGDALWARLSQITGKNYRLEHRTVVLPMEAGGIDRSGMLNPKAVEAALDVAEEEARDSQRERWLHRSSPDHEEFLRMATGEKNGSFPTELREKERLTLSPPDEGEDEPESLDLVLLVSPQRSAVENPETASALQTLADHSESIAHHMGSIAGTLDLPDSLSEALVLAARWHDAGKDRMVWQRYARNPGAEPLAKSPHYLHPRALGGYRHEFGSLLDAMADGAVGGCGDPDLVLHLVAAHHGWARPHFEPRSHDSTRTSKENDEVAWEVLRRFGRLQQRYGRWGLAWLESLLRCADIAASREAVESRGTSRPKEVGR